MAIVIQPALSVMASGNLGAINYTRWRGRAVARIRSDPTIPNTAKQIVIQGYLGTAVVNWRTVLTEAMREAWRVYARTQLTIGRLGEKRAPGGYDLYVSRCIQTLRMSAPALLWPPVKVIAGQATGLLLTTSGAGGNVRWKLDGWVNTWRSYLGEHWRTDGFGSEAKHPQEEEWRFYMYRPSNMRASYTGTPGAWYWLRARIVMSDGRVGLWLTGQMQAPT